MILPDLQALWLTFKLAALTVVILFLLGLPLAWKISRYRGRFKPFIEAMVSLPLILPPTVLGFYLLIAFSPESFLGGLWIQLFGEQFVFSFGGILVGSIIYSMPFVMQPLIAAFEQQGTQVLMIAQTLGVSKYRAFYFWLLPQIKPALITAATLGFAHTLGEFGLILMIGGNIPGQTQVVSIALYQHVEMLDYASANKLALILLVLSFAILTLLFRFNRSAARFNPAKDFGGHS
ncbi:molybdate ABC transporter permease subunit [Glaciecola sp. 1036]|uniref:molybdate ABC transporter permease subunit n=1 Tax=Alteromonadaceae TaxID=72275 RepID=UPI003D00EF74